MPIPVSYYKSKHTCVTTHRPRKTVPGHVPRPGHCLASQGNPSMTSNTVDSFWLLFELSKIGTIPHDIFCMWLPLFSTRFVRFVYFHCFVTSLCTEYHDLFILSTVDVDSRFWLLQIILLWTFFHVFRVHLCVRFCWGHTWNCRRHAHAHVQLWWTQTHGFPGWSYQPTLLPTATESSSYSIALPTRGTLCPFHFSHSGGVW